ncbi:MAG: AAA family ATPase [Kiritimatiellae bacterium]|nr:AAA family ATPase [Kiritimatiellia bacterium]
MKEENTTAAESAIATGPVSETAPIVIGGDKLKPALAERVAANKFTQRQADLIWWFFCMCREKAWSSRQAASAIGLSSPSTISRLFACNYEASVQSICDRIERYKRSIEERGNVNDMPFVETSISRDVEKVCKAAWFSQSVAFIWGESQTGKTYALRHYQATHNHGATKYIRVPTAATIQLASAEIARACAVSGEGEWSNIRQRILKAVDSQNLVIVDEAHQVFTTTADKQAKKVLEFLREVHDRTGCGMVMCMTNMGRDAIETSSLAPVFKQLSRRGVVKLQLPDTAPLRDYLDIAAAAFSLPAPEGQELETVKHIRVAGGIGVYCKYLQMARRLADNKEETLAWSHFQAAYDALAALSKKGGAR